MAELSTVALYPTPTNRKMAVCPSETPSMWFCRCARVVPILKSMGVEMGIQKFPYPTLPSAP